MTSVEAAPLPHDRHARRRPFSSWMKRLANLKTLHSDSVNTVAPKRVTPSKSKNIAKNDPYPQSHRAESTGGQISFSTPLSSQRSRHSSLSQSKHSISISHDGQNTQKSRAPTLATTAETTTSEAGQSAAPTSTTNARTDGDRNSTFSSPAPSVRSMTTTLTTIQSVAPPLQQTATANTSQSIPSTSYSHFPPPASAVPSHLAPHSQPTTYHSATAGGVLTDNASILTLASSSKRRRRNSVDTNASMKALAPASMFGGSRESLPLSVLSGTIINPGGDNGSIRDVGYGRSVLNVDRASLISASGVTAPVLASERNSYIGSKYGDAASVRSGLLGGGHGRNDSMTGSLLAREHKEKERDSTLTSSHADGASNHAAVIADKGRASMSRRSSTFMEGDGLAEEDQED